jgi:hypothetical protein
MRREKEGETRYRVKSIDKVERTGPKTVKVEATFIEDDRPRGHGRGRHEVTGHWETVKGKRVWIRDHEAANPRR